MKASDTLRKKRDAVTKAIDDLTLSEFMEKIPDQIRKRTKEGSGITEEDGRRKPLKRLEESTTKTKGYAIGRGEVASDAAPPPKSNLTWTGQMLDSIKLVKKSKKRVAIEATGTRRSGLSNAKLVGYVEKLRRFMGLTAVERRELEKNLANAINKKIKAIFK